MIFDIYYVNLCYFNTDNILKIINDCYYNKYSEYQYYCFDSIVVVIVINDLNYYSLQNNYYLTNFAMKYY